MPTLARRFTRRPLLVALVVTLLSLAPLGVANPAEGAPNCPIPGPLGFGYDLSNGEMRIGRFARSMGISADGCGQVELTPMLLDGVIHPDNLEFAPATTKVLFFGLPTTIRLTGDLRGPTLIAPTTMDPSFTGPMAVDLHVDTVVCTIGPFTPTLTTGPSGDITGTTLTPGPDGVYRGRMVAKDFAVPKIEASAECPPLAAAILNFLLRLPLPAGKSSLGFDAAVALQLGT